MTKFEACYILVVLGAEKIVCGEKMSEEENQKLKVILHRVSAGEESAIIEFGKIMAPKIKTMVFSICGNFDELDDIIQETYIAILKTDLAKVKDQNIYGWVYQIIRHKIIDRYRLKRAFGFPADMECIKQICRQEQIEDVLLLYELFRQLNAEERQLIAMKYFGGMTYQEISRQVHKPLSRVYRRIEEIIKNLQNILDL